MASPWSIWILSTLLLCAAVCPLAEGFQWQNEETLMVNGCIGSTVTIPWNFSTDVGESLGTVFWFRFARETIASLADGQVTNPNRRFSPSRSNAAISIAGLNSRDTGLYEVDVKVLTTNKKGQKSEVTHTASAVLTVGDPPSISGDKLTIQEVTSNEVCALQRKTTLRCGHFTKRGVPPVEIMWTDPAGQQFPSSRYADGWFDLDLPRRPLAGNYTCHVMCGKTPAILQCLAPKSPLLASTPNHHLQPPSPSSRQGCSSSDVDDDASAAYVDGVPEKKGEGEESSAASESLDSQAVKSLESNVTQLKALLTSLQNEQGQMKETSADRDTQFMRKVEELRELVLLSNQQSGGAQLHVLQQTVNGLQTTVHDIQQNITALQQQMASNKPHVPEQVPAHNQRVEQVLDAFDDIKIKLSSNGQTIRTIENEVSSLTIDLTRTQNTLSLLENVLNVNVDKGESSPDGHAHEKNITDLHQSLKSLEELHEEMNRELIRVSDAQKTCERKQENMTRNLGSLSFRVDVLDRGVARRVDKAVSQCNVTRSELSRLTWRIQRVEAEGEEGGGGGGGEPPSLGGRVEQMAMEPGLDPLVSEAKPSASVFSPWDGRSDSLLHDFIITPDGQVVMADRYHPDVIMAPNASMGDVTTRRLRYGSHIRRMTYMQDGVIAATVDDHYIYLLDTTPAPSGAVNPGPSPAKERWVRTSHAYHGVAARSPQTLFVGVDALEDESEGAGGARVDVISIVDDVAVVVSTVLNRSMTSELRTPASLTVRRDDDDELYVSDWDSGVVIRVALSTLQVTVFSGPGQHQQQQMPGSQPMFFQPRQTAFDVSGNMYVSTGGTACGKGLKGDHQMYSQGFCVVVVSQEGWWKRLITRGAHIYPYGVALTPTGLAVSWGSWVGSPTRSLVQWYDLVDPNA